MGLLTFLILQDNSEKVNKDIFWPDLVERLWHQKTLLNPIYDNQDHGVSCKCCSRIVKESVTCPTKKERERRSRKPQRGKEADLVLEGEEEGGV